MRKQLVESLATGFYLGKIPWAPGTWGTLLGVPLVLLLVRGGPYFYMIACLLLVFFAALVSELHERFTAEHDPSEIVIDEVVGFAIAMTWLPMTWQAFALGFLIFRFFDIFKPFPIRTIDRKIEGGFGTVLDDVAAGIATNFVLQVIYIQTAWLGVKFDGAF